MFGMRVLPILAVIFALVLAWLCFLLISLAFDKPQPWTPVKIEAQESALTKGDADKGQLIASQVCAVCHSPDGNSIIPANPILAGQHAKYITKQLNDYKAEGDNPAKRNSPIMAAMVVPLSSSDMINLGAYYTTQVSNPRAAKDKELADLGENVYRGGNIESGVPACASCHSPNGVGIPPLYPRLAGQHAEYTVAQLRAFRTEQRANDVNNVMRDIVTHMSEKEMQAVAEFISGLQ